MKRLIGLVGCALFLLPPSLPQAQGFVPQRRVLYTCIERIVRSMPRTSDWWAISQTAKRTCGRELYAFGAAFTGTTWHPGCPTVSQCGSALEGVVDQYVRRRLAGQHIPW